MFSWTSFPNPLATSISHKRGCQCQIRALTGCSRFAVQPGHVKTGLVFRPRIIVNLE